LKSKGKKRGNIRGKLQGYSAIQRGGEKIKKIVGALKKGEKEKKVSPKKKSPGTGETKKCV